MSAATPAQSSMMAMLNTGAAKPVACLEQGNLYGQDCNSLACVLGWPVVDTRVSVSAWKLKLANVLMSFLTLAAVFPAVGVNWMHVCSLGDTDDSDLRRIHSIREYFVAYVELNQLERAADGRYGHPQVGRRKLTSIRMVDFEMLVARKLNLSLGHTKLLIRGDMALRVALTGSAAPKQVPRTPVSPASPDNATSQTTFMTLMRESQYKGLSPSEKESMMFMAHPDYHRKPF